jgi:hypothetical protein
MGWAADPNLECANNTQPYLGNTILTELSTKALNSAALLSPLV